MLQFTCWTHIIWTSGSTNWLIFSTRFECGFRSSPLVSSVVLDLLHSFRVYFHIFSTRFECSLRSSPPVSSVVLAPSVSHESSEETVTASQIEQVKAINRVVKIHSKRVEKMWIYTRNEWERCQSTLETSGKDVNLNSKRVRKMSFYTRNECEISSFRLMEKFPALSTK